ncbi:MAG: hypothetical protein P8M16_02900 [Acidimicrobiales bacterium]|jgi:hypothetical protein|nr:hypothetical protein [Acidimicrobiales bacterium]|tara:strand:- start:254 stop:538 length:285 start_codon:yes stop_codon:yes gene_type:complete
MRWSVSLRAEGDRVLVLEEVVAFADAIAPMEGIASGIGAMTYGAQLVIEAETSDQAVNLAIPAFEEAAAAAGLPVWPLTGAEVVGEHDEFEDLE